MSINFDRYAEYLLERQYPTPADEPVVVAEVGATKMPERGYTGENPAMMQEYDPTMRERMAEFLQAGFERFGMDRYKARQQAQTLMGGPSSNLPITLGVADILPYIGTAMQTEEAARGAVRAVQDVQAGEPVSAAIEGGAAALGMVPSASSTIKTTKSMVKKMGAK